MTRRLLIRGGTIVSLDPAVGTLRSGDLLVEDGRIAAIAPGIEVEAEIVDAAGRVVIPGLVDAHRHLWYETVRGIAMDATLRDLRVDLWPNLAARYTPDDVYVATRAGIVDALDNGITTVLDWCHIINTPEHGDEAIRAHDELPIRSVFAYGVSMTRKLDEFAGETGDETAREEVAKLAGGTRAGPGGRTTFALALQGPESTSMEITEREVALARELGLPMTMHVGLQEGAPPKRSVGRLADAGLLGPDMQFVHCCTTSEAELVSLALAGASVVVCPMAEIALAIGTPPTGRARDAGLRPAFGADAVCSASGDLFDEARAALLGERSLRAQPLFEADREVADAGRLGLTSAEALEGITVNGAAACWLGDRIGSLAVGKRADIVLLRELDVDVASLGDIRATVVASAHGANVDTVIVDGEVVKRDGALTGIDRDRLGAALAASRERLFSEAGYAVS